VRESKYKAWDRDGKRMWTVSKIEFIAKYVVVRDIVNGIVETDELRNFDLLKYIGVNDKNGKEIYEFDIAKSLLGRIFPIKYLCGAFMFGDVPICDMTPGYDLEIIGNFYEHPELLSDKAEAVQV